MNQKFLKLAQSRHAYMRQAILAHLFFVIPSESVLVNWTTWFYQTNQILSQKVALCFVLIAMISGTFSILFEVGHNIDFTAGKLALNFWTFLAGASVCVAQTIFTCNGYYLGGKTNSWQYIYWWVSVGLWLVSFCTMVSTWFVASESVGNSNDFEVFENENENDQAEEVPYKFVGKVQDGKENENNGENNESFVAV